MSSTMDDHNKHVTGYPTTTYPPPPPQTNQHQPTAYPPPQNSYLATGVGYPYRPPPPPPPPAAYYNPNPDPPQSNHTPRRSTFLQRAIMSGICLFVIIGPILLFLILHRPKNPEISVDSASVSNFSLSSSSSQLTSNWEIVLLIRNPDKRATIYYDKIDSEVLYKDKSLTKKPLEPFFQNSKTERILTSSFTASSTYVVDQTMTEMIRDRNNGGVNFNFKMLTLIRFGYGDLVTRGNLMRVLCKNIKIEFLSSTSSTGKLAAGIKNCKITW